MSTSPTPIAPSEADKARARCPICNWPYADSAANGCVPFQCSYRTNDPIALVCMEGRRAIVEQVRAEATAAARAEQREADAQIADSWTRAGHIQLHAGEMKAQELRSVIAVSKAIAVAIRKGQPG